MCIYIFEQLNGLPPRMQINLAGRNTFNEATCVTLQSHLPQQPPYRLYEVHKYSVSFTGKKTNKQKNPSELNLIWSCTNTCIMMDNCLILCNSVVKFLGCILSSLYPPGGLGGELLRLHVKRSQLRWCRHLIRMPPGSLPLEGFLGTSNWEKTKERSQNSVKRLYISSGLRERPGSPRRSWKLLLGRGEGGGGLEYPAYPAGTKAQDWCDKMGQMDGILKRLI